MIFIDASNRNQILSFLPLIKDNYAEWHVINLKFDAKDMSEANNIVQKYIDGYAETKGFVYIEDITRAISIIRLGEIESYSEVQNRVSEKMNDKRCSVRAQKMTNNGLKQIQINLTEGVSKNSALFKEREERDESVIMVVDDDMFIRKTVMSLLKSVATAYEVEDAKDALENYKKFNPDVVIMDIHMPNSNGLDVIKQIIEEDANAFILISSSDSTKENVMKAIKEGAAGFLAKPLQKEKLFEFTDQCITFTNKEPEET